jgi:hypothetical protein
MLRSGCELTGARRAPYENSTLLCHSEEYSDEESGFDFYVLIEGIGKAQSRCFTEFTLRLPNGSA